MLDIVIHQECIALQVHDTLEILYLNVRHLKTILLGLSRS